MFLFYFHFSYFPHPTSSNENIIYNNIIYNNTYDGILIETSSGNIVIGNTIYSNSEDGIYTLSATNTTIKGNTIIHNTGYGIYLNSSSDNLIYNNYFSNTNSAWDNGNNKWNISKTQGTNIIGGTYLGGNYWSDYNGIDTDGDGLGDTFLPYNGNGDILNGGDWSPLVEPSQPDIRVEPDHLDFNVGNSPSNGNSDSIVSNIEIGQSGRLDADANSFNDPMALFSFLFYVPFAILSFCIVICDLSSFRSRLRNSENYKNAKNFKKFE